MIRKSIILIPVLIAPLAISAATFTNDRFGYTIDIDDSFHLARNDEATYFGSSEHEGVIAIRNWPGLDEETAKTYLQQGYQDARIAIVPAGDLEEIAVANGKGFLVDIDGIIERRRVKGVAAGIIGDQGQGMVVMFTAPEESWDKLKTTVSQSTASIKFIEFEQGPAAREWHYILAGTRLSFRGKVNDDRRVREDLNLCSDGSFRHRVSSSAITDSDSGSAFGHSAKSRSGDWRVVDDDGAARLLLRYTDGRSESARIEDREGQIYIDGRHYRRLRKSSCR